MHLSPEDFHRIRGGTATGAEARHLATCSSCAALLADDRALDASAAALRGAFTDFDDGMHPDESELAAYVDGSIGLGKGETVREHLRACDGCRSEVEDLTQWTTPAAPSRRRMYTALAAAAAVLVFAALLVRDPPRPAATQPVGPAISTTRAPVPQPAPLAVRSEWDALVEGVRATRTLPLPAYLSGLADRDTFRGGGQPARASEVWPTGTAIESDRPELRWRGTEGSVYTVSIVDGSKVVAESAPLTVPRWRPEKPLARGKTYSWQVAVSDAQVIPAPPEPPALFRVLESSEVAELERARSERPGDHLLLAVVYARAGVIDAARRELEAHAATGDALAGELLRQLPATP